MTTSAKIDADLDQLEAASARITVAVPKITSLVPRPTIALIVETTVAADWNAIARALQMQIDRDFASSWATSAHIVVTDRAHAPAGSWWLVILDDSDMARALGYHELTAQGLPIGKVFAKTDLQFNLLSSVTASHELCEMLADPWIDRLAGFYTIGGAPAVYALEVCDAVEADQLGYPINGIQVSDFVTPAWFHPGEAGPFSFHNSGTTSVPHYNTTGALQLAPGGYISIWTPAAGWTQQNAELSPFQRTLGQPRVNAGPGSRRERRQRRPSWQRSRAA